MREGLVGSGMERAGHSFLLRLPPLSSDGRCTTAQGQAHPTTIVGLMAH